MTSPSPETETGCCDFQSSRRRFLQGATALVGGAALSTMSGGVFRQVAFAETGTADNVLVVLSLRGGVDGLSLVVPYGDPYYSRARDRIAVQQTLPTGDGFFGLHPALEPLLPMWKAGEFAAVHAVGLPQPNRSHFAAMEQMEDADPGSSMRRGWLNRMVGLDRANSPLEAVQLGSPTVPTSLYGRSAVVAGRALRDLRLTGGTTAKGRRRRRRALHRTWNHADGALGRGARSALTTASRVQHLATTPTRPNATYPQGDLGKALAETARLLRADVGVETVTLDYGSWDLHAGLGNLDNGAMRVMTAELAEALAAFFTDLGAEQRRRVTVVTISEFGRRVEENGSAGADHGWGNVMLALGAGVRGGRVYGTWPGLGAGKLVDGDLAVTTDYRLVLREVLRARFPDVNTSKVFPNFVDSGTVGLMR